MSATHFSITICFFLPSACIASTRFLYLCSIATRFSMNFDASRSALRMSGQIRKQSTPPRQRVPTHFAYRSLMALFSLMSTWERGQ